MLPLAAAVLVLAGCAGGDDGSSSEAAAGPTVVATTSVWADVVDAATCRGDAGIEVAALIPPGSDPHGYEPSLRDRQALDGAALVVSNGLGLEAGVTDLLEQVEPNRLVEVAELPEVEVHENGDPHVWLDPTIVASTAEPLASRIAEAVGVDPAQVDACAADFATALGALDDEIAVLVDTLPAERRVLVTNHDAYGYFAERYGFEIAGTVIPSTSTLAETNAADLADVAATIDEHGVPAIFVDAGHSAADAQALADQVGVDVVSLDTESVGQGDGDDDYISMMRSNAEAIVAALAG